MDIRTHPLADAHRPATLRLDTIGRFVEADPLALHLLGAGTIGELMAAPPQRFPVLRPFPAERAAWQRAAVSRQADVSMGEAADAVIAEGLLRPLEGPAVRLRVAFVSCGEQGYVVLCYATQRHAPDAMPELYRIPDVLAAWRLHDRRLRDGGLARADAHDLYREVALLRALYHVLFARSASAQPWSPPVSTRE